MTPDCGKLIVRAKIDLIGKNGFLGTKSCSYLLLIFVLLPGFLGCFPSSCPSSMMLCFTIDNLRNEEVNKLKLLTLWDKGNLPLHCFSQVLGHSDGKLKQCYWFSILKSYNSNVCFAIKYLYVYRSEWIGISWSNLGNFRPVSSKLFNVYFLAFVFSLFENPIVYMY